MANDIENRGPDLLGVNITFAVLAVLTAMLRGYVRIGIVKKFALDDWVMLVALIFFLLYCASSITGVAYGTGRHHADLSKEGIRQAKMCWWFCYLTYAIAMMASKLSIAIFLLRVVRERIHKWVLYGAVFISIFTGTAFFFITLLQCRPLYYFWAREKDEQEGRCVDPSLLSVLGAIYSVFAIISDITFVVLPSFLVWKLSMKRKAKIALIPLLSMGCIASAAVVARFPYLFKLDSPDFLWDTLDTAIWSTVEQGLAISAGCLATTRPLFRMITSSFGQTSYGPSGYVTGTAGGGVPSGLRSLRHSRADDLGLSSMRKGRYSEHKISPPTSDEISRDNSNNYHISIRADRNATPELQDHIVVTTNVQSVNHPLQKSESEEWLAYGGATR